MPFTARIERYTCSLQACSISLQGWGLIDLPLRAAFSPAHPLARRDVPLAQARGLLGRALREHRRSSGSIPSSVLPCAHRTIYMFLPSSLVLPLLEGHPCWSKCGRRTRPFSGRAFREHRTNVGVLPPFSPLTDPPPPGYDRGYLIRP